MANLRDLSDDKKGTELVVRQEPEAEEGAPGILKQVIGKVGRTAEDVLKGVDKGIVNVAEQVTAATEKVGDTMSRPEKPHVSLEWMMNKIDEDRAVNAADKKLLQEKEERASKMLGHVLKQAQENGELQESLNLKLDTTIKMDLQHRTATQYWGILRDALFGILGLAVLIKLGTIGRLMSGMPAENRARVARKAVNGISAEEEKRSWIH